MSDAPTKRGLGWKPDVPDARDHKYAAARHTGPLPLTVDLRPLFPPVYDQGKVQDCVLNAIGSVIQYNLRRDKMPDYLPSRLFSYYNVRETEGTINSDAGCEIRNAIKSVVSQGVCAEDHWPHDPAKFAEQPSNLCYSIAEKNFVTRYSRVPQTANGVRACLAAGDPVIFGFSVYENFEGDDIAEHGVLGMPSSEDGMFGGHAVVACGYNNTTKMFLIRNSWGAAWGLPEARGHFRMPYDYLLDPNLADDLWCIQQVGHVVS